MKQAIAPMLNTSRNANALTDSVTVKRTRCHLFSAPHTSATESRTPMAKTDASMFELPKIPYRRAPLNAMLSVLIAGSLSNSSFVMPVLTASTLKSA